MFKTQINQLLVAIIVFNTIAAIGCHRSYYRRQADAEAHRLIREKSLDPRWDTAEGNIDIAPESRMFNPFSQDHPPIPPDDPDSHQFMYRVDGKEGYPHWHANGDTNYVEAPEWKRYLPVNEKGQVVLNLDRAYQLALLHSPLLQRQRESLYLAALDVSLERFGFDTQLFAGWNSFFTNSGRLDNGGSSSTLSSSFGANGGGINFRRLGITGTNFAVGLANTILFNFSGDNTQSASSLIDFSVIQPLLRGAGRDRIMESLTQSERDLLANVRQLDRFRRGFFLEVAIGRNPGAGISGNLLSTPGQGTSNVGGFYGLLEDQQRIRNQEFNVRQLEAVLEQFNEFFERERLDAVQLKLFETNVYTQQRNLLDLKTNYQLSLDQFKVRLGLPPDLDVVIEDSYLDRFELISDQVNERLISISSLREETGAALNNVDVLFDAKDEEGFEWNQFEWPTDVVDKIEALTPYVEQAETTLEKIVTEDRNQLEKDFSKLDATRAARLGYLENVAASVESGRLISSIDPDLFAPDSIPTSDTLRELLVFPELDEKEFIIVNGKREIPPRSILKRASMLKLSLAEVKQKIAAFRELEPSLRRQLLPNEEEPQLFKYYVDEFAQTIPGQLSELNNLMLEFSLLQALARSNSIEINDVTLDSEQAMRIARCMRRDLMNARAALVDQWRNIEFVADQLESQVDLVFDGNIGNFGDNPFKIRWETGQVRAGFRFDAPIVRLAERNNYRRALINYQQSRRQFYQFEDAINQNLRNIIRNIDRNKVLFELDRRRVQVQIENVEINRFELERPVAANASARLGTQTARNLTDSIIGLNNAQNSFLRSWIQFEVLRRNLDFDLGTMQLDETARWIDPGEIDSSVGVRAAAMMGVELDCQFCENIGVSYEALTSGSGMSQGILPLESGTELQSIDSIIEPLETQPRRLEGLQPSTGGQIDGGASNQVSPMQNRTSSLRDRLYKSGSPRASLLERARANSKPNGSSAPPAPIKTSMIEQGKSEDDAIDRVSSAVALLELSTKNLIQKTSAVETESDESAPHKASQASNFHPLPSDMPDFKHSDGDSSKNAGSVKPISGYDHTADWNSLMSKAIEVKGEVITETALVETSDATPQTDWKSESFSLGEVLNRFRTESQR